jgi:hypothetical protein
VYFLTSGFLAALLVVVAALSLFNAIRYLSNHPREPDTAIFASASTWAGLRQNPAFIELVRLARVVNSLTLSYPPLLSSFEDQSPRARRERFAAMLYAGALLHEGLHTAQGLAQHFRNLPQYKEEFAAIFSDPEVTQFRSNVLDRIRDELVFHFDRDSLAVGLSHFPDGETMITVTAGTDWSHGETYFELADDSLLAYLFGDAPDEKEYQRRVADLIERITQLFNRFTRAAHRLIPAALRDMGCYTKSVERPLAPE